MWSTLRRASLPLSLRKRGLNVRVSSCVKIMPPNTCADNNNNEVEICAYDGNDGFLSQRNSRCYHYGFGSVVKNNKFSPKTKPLFESELFQAIMDTPGLSVRTALCKFVKKGNELNSKDISFALLNLRKLNKYEIALQLSEELESIKHLDLEFDEIDYALRLDLIAKVHGLHKEEIYFESIPESFRGEIIYKTLMAYCVTQNNLKKAEEIFNKMKDLEFPLTVFTCNSLLHLYNKRNETKKIADVLLLMEHENVEPDELSFKMLIAVKGQSNDIDGMDQIVDKMKAKGIELDIQTKASLASHYISAGLVDKAKTALKEIGDEDLEKADELSFKMLIAVKGQCNDIDGMDQIVDKMKAKGIELDIRTKASLARHYISAGLVDKAKTALKEIGDEDLEKADEVGNVLGCSAWIKGCFAVIEDWIKLKEIDEAEAVFQMMSKKWERMSKNWSEQMKADANNMMLTKANDLIKRMEDSGCQIGPLTWDALIKLYVHAGEVYKADNVLQKAVLQSKVKPLFSSYITVQEEYSKAGDIVNAEKVKSR